MKAAYDEFAADNRVQPLPLGYNQLKQLAINTIQQKYDGTLLVVLGLLLFATLFWGLGQYRRHLLRTASRSES